MTCMHFSRIDIYPVRLMMISVLASLDCSFSLFQVTAVCQWCMFIFIVPSRCCLPVVYVHFHCSKSLLFASGVCSFSLFQVAAVCQWCMFIFIVPSRCCLPVVYVHFHCSKSLLFASGVLAGCLSCCCLPVMFLLGESLTELLLFASDTFAG